MRVMARTKYAAMLLTAAVAAAGCGGGDDSGSQSAGTSGASGPLGATTPQLGASGSTGGARAARPKRAAKSKDRSDNKRGAAQEQSTSPSPSPSPTPTPTSPTPSPPKPAKPRTLNPVQQKQAARGLFTQARLLCKATTLQTLAQYYGINSGNVDDVAKTYAAGYPAGPLRKGATAGCKKGLLESK
jgi:hypothetical protein